MRLIKIDLISFFCPSKNMIRNGFDTFVTMKRYLYSLLIVISCLYGCDPTYSDADLRIAYNVDDGGLDQDYDIYVMNIDGSNPINISNNNGVDWVYTAYDNSLFVLSDRNECKRCFYLYETDTKGSQWRKISDIRLADSWISTRHEGKELIVKPYAEEINIFNIISIQGDIISKVKVDLPYANDPCFSPDGNQIVFRGSRLLDDNNQPTEVELYTMNVDGTNLNQITFGKSDKQIATQPRTPRWNAVTNDITFSSPINDAERIYRINPTSKSTIGITTRTAKAIWHDVSMDGRYLAYDAKLNFISDSNNYNIFILDSKTRNVEKITNGRGKRLAPVFVYEK